MKPRQGNELQGHAHGHVHGKAAENISAAFFLNAFFVVVEAVGGWATNSVAVLVAAAVMLVADVPALDPHLSLAITLWVLVNVFRNLRSVFRILLQAVPDGVDPAALKARLLALDGVEAVHDLHLWSLDGESHVMTLHVVTPAADTRTIKRAIVAAVRLDRIAHVTIEFERPGTPCDTDCDHLQTT